MRLYDEVESERNHETEAGVNVLLVLDEGDGAMVDAGMEVVAEECEHALRLEDGLVDHWFEKRNDVAALEALISRGYVVDTMEVAGPWAALPGAFESVIADMQAVPGTLAVSATSRTRTRPAAACTSRSPPRWSPTSATPTTSPHGTRAPVPRWPRDAP